MPRTLAPIGNLLLKMHFLDNCKFIVLKMHLLRGSVSQGSHKIDVLFPTIVGPMGHKSGVA